MRSRTRLAAMLLAGVLAAPAALAADAPARWLGTWTLNLARSTYTPGPPPYRRATRRIAASAGAITITEELVRSRGGLTHLEWTGAFDGLDYPVQGVEVVLTNAYRRIDDVTYELLQKVDGEVVGTARLVMSPDGRTITVSASSPLTTATLIYDKQ